MKLEHQVCSLELAKRLRELGVKQKSQFSWFDTQTFGLKLERENTSFDLGDYGEVTRICSAFCVAELGEMLPVAYRSWKFIGDMKTEEWTCQSPDTNHFEDANFEADARAGMLVYLLENKLIEAK